MDPYIDVCNNMLLKDRVYNTLKNEIILGNLEPGHVLNIFELSSMMNISSAPIREALNMLGKDGFVTLAPRKQATVANASFHDWKVVAEMRRLLEPYAAQISTKLIPQEEVDKLRQTLDQVMDAPDPTYAYLDSDRALHHMLHAYCNSKVLSETLNTLKEHTMRARYFADQNAGTKKETVLASTTEHFAILDAIETRDPDKVYAAVLQHVEHYMKRVDNAHLF